ncbi:MAG: hypothetical protein DRI65_08225 [Chloroflexota bacterium]|nr:MAG: hypothetical protein DRI65_08225 [Chloroflexota bacterium]HDD62380.1 hypothetical protein [Chloroflexota bacterium]
MNWMKKIGLLFVVVMLLTACGTADKVVDEVDTIGEQRAKLQGDYENALSPALQLVVGTLMLEETDLALDAEMATTLIPYWKLYTTLTESDSTALEELDALVNEIEGLMTTDQINYIVGLELTQESMLTIIEELGIMEDLRTGEGDGTGANRPEGMPEGTRPGGGQGRSGAEGVDPELMATMQASRAEEGGAGTNRMIKPLIVQLISQLEEIAGN